MQAPDRVDPIACRVSAHSAPLEDTTVWKSIGMMRPADRQPEKNTHCSALSALGLVPMSEIPPECRGVVVVWGISTLAARKNVAM